MSMGASNKGTVGISEGFFDLIQNADLYQARLKAIKEAEDSMRNAEESLGLGREARLALNEATALKADAKKELEQAQSKAKGILDAAAEKARGVIDYAEASAASTNEKVVATEARLADLQAAIDEIEAGIAAQREDALSLMARAQAAMGEAEAVKAEYEEKLSKLKSLL